VNKFSRRNTWFIVQNSSGRKDGRNSLRRIHEFPGLLDITEEQGRYGEYSREVQSSGGAGPYIRAIRAIGFKHVCLYRVFVGGSPVNVATGIAIFRYVISRKSRGFVGPQRSQRCGQVARHFGDSWSKIPNSLH
jgi:hypothetical protein